MATEECRYLYHITTWSLGYKGTVDVTCPAGQSIKISGGTCKAEIKSQSGLGAVDFGGNSEGVLLQDTVKGVAYTVTQDSFGCPLTGTGAKTGGEFVSEAPTVLAGKEGVGFHIG